MYGNDEYGTSYLASHLDTPTSTPCGRQNSTLKAISKLTTQSAPKNDGTS